VTADLFDNQLMHLAHFKQKVPELLHSLKIDQSYTEKGKKRFLVKLMQNLALVLVDTSSCKSLFPESLVEIFSNLKKDHQVAYKLKKKNLNC